MVAQVIALLLGTTKTFPIVDRWVQMLVAAYIASRIGSMSKDQRDGIRKAIDEQDQRDLEKAIGNPQAGEPSGLPGVEHRPTLPGVH